MCVKSSEFDVVKIFIKKLTFVSQKEQKKRRIIVFKKQVGIRKTNWYHDISHRDILLEKLRHVAIIFFRNFRLGAVKFTPLRPYGLIWDQMERTGGNNSFWRKKSRNSEAKFCGAKCRGADFHDSKQFDIHES